MSCRSITKEAYEMFGRFNCAYSIHNFSHAYSSQDKTLSCVCVEDMLICDMSVHIGMLMRLITIVLFLMASLQASRLELRLTQAQKSLWPIALQVDSRISKTISEVLEQDIKLSGALTLDPQRAQATYVIEPCDQNVCIGRTGLTQKAVIAGSGSDVMLAHHLMDYVMQDALGTPGWFHHRLAYVITEGNNLKDRRYRLEVSDILGQEVHTLFKSSEPIMSPAWSHSGDKLAYVSFEEQRPTLWVQELNSGKRWQVSAEPGINGAPAWSPDDKQMALVLSKSGTPKLFLLNIESGDLKQLTSGSSIDTEPQWMEDGSSLVFTSSRSGTPQIYQYYLQQGKIERITFHPGAHVRPTLGGAHRMLTLSKEQRWGVLFHDLANDQQRYLSASGSEDQPMLHPQGYLAIYTKRFGSQTMLEIAHVSDSIRYRLPASSGFIRFPTWSHS